jgi:hypothetical protein
LAILQWATRKWPAGFEQIDTRDIIDAGKKDPDFKKTVHPASPFPGRDQFLRALDRRRD